MVGGLSLDELASRTGCSRRSLRLALREEVASGCVLVEDGLFRLRPGSLLPAVAEALLGLPASSVAELKNGRRRQPGGGRLNQNEQHNLTFVVY